MATSHWFLGGGAEHTAEMVRRDTYAKLAGAEGVCEVADLRVLQTPVAGGNVRVTIGSAYITSRYSAAVRETYMGSVVTQETVPIPQNDSGSIRRDLIVMRVHDPYVQGSPWPDPGAGIEDPEEAAEARAGAQYVFIERIPSVPAGTTRLQEVPGYENDTAYALARIDIPATTGTITTAMIVDLRQVHTRRIFTEQRLKNLTIADEETLVATRERGEWFPNYGGLQYIDVPPWATRMQVEAWWVPVISGPGSCNGRCWVEYGDAAGGSTPGQDREYMTQHATFNSANTTDTKNDTWALFDTRAVPAALRGQKQVPFIMKARIDSTTAPGARPTMNWSSQTALKVTFYEDALSASDS